MTRVWIGLACVVVFTSASPGRVLAQTVGADVFEALRARERVRVIVSFREPLAGDLAGKRAAVSQMRADVLQRVAPFDITVKHAYEAIPALTGEVTSAGLAAILSSPEVLRVDIDPVVRASLAQSVPLIHADEVHDMGFTGRGIVVAVLDSGVDENHPDIKGGLLAEECFCTAASGAGCCPNATSRQSGAGSAPDDNGHGTNVAGIAVGKGAIAPKGVAPDGQIVDIKVLASDGSGSFSEILNALDFVLTNHPEVKVVNVSIEGPLFSGTCDADASFTQSFASAASSLLARGTIVFASSGNNASATQVAAPACVSSVVAVGAVYKANVGAVSFGCTDASTSADQVTCFTNSGAKVAIMAPGAAVTAAGRGGGTSTYLGTSQACPMASGAAALLFQAKPGITPAQITQALVSTGVKVTDKKNGQVFPRIDVKAALTAAQGVEGATAVP